MMAVRRRAGPAMHAMAAHESDNPLRKGLRRERGAEPCALVIFGGSGDLARRKLLPALYNLHVDRLLPGGFAVVCVARKPRADDEFRQSMAEAVRAHSRRRPSDDLWSAIADGLSYVVAGEDDGGFGGLAAHLDEVDRRRATSGNRLFYLATPPDAVPGIVGRLREAGLHRPGRAGSWARIVLEKPIGRDLSSARELNRAVSATFAESAIYRIDHYLGKETVQNLLVFRFGNAILEPLWNQKYVDHVQITVAESLGIEDRGDYYDRAGATRDMLQNHVSQLLCLTAMEPPVSLEPDAIRDEKVKVLHAVRPLGPDQVREATVRGQYAEGVIDGRPVPGYRDEPRVAPDSGTETYVAARLHVDNWRWAGVPFYVRSGKRLAKRITEVALRFRDVPHRLFTQPLAANTLALGIQPDEGITLGFNSKVPGPRPRIQPVGMDFRYGTSFGLEPPEAYERLILDAILGDATLFIRRDEVETSWGIVDSLFAGWAETRTRVRGYPAGSWGPQEADDLVAHGGRAWRRL